MTKNVCKCCGQKIETPKLILGKVMIGGEHKIQLDVKDSNRKLLHRRFTKSDLVGEFIVDVSGIELLPGYIIEIISTPIKGITTQIDVNNSMIKQLRSDGDWMVDL